MSNPVRIQITSGQVDTEGKATNDTSVPKADNKVNGTTNSTLKAIAGNQLFRTGVNSAKALGQYAVSQYGNFTGDYLAQRNIENLVAGVNAASGFATSIVGGAMVGGVAGAAVAGLVYATGQVINVGLSLYSSNMQNKRTNQATAFNSQIIGSILQDGNR